MIELRDIQREYIREHYAKSIAQQQKYIEGLKQDDLWELMENAEEVLQGLKDECEWLISDERAMDEYLKRHPMGT